MNPENDWCDCLTVEQLKAIWQPESAVSKWSDLNPEWPDEKIKLYGPGTDSGTFDYFTEAIVGKARSSRADYTPSEDDNVLVTGVAGDKYALGYFGFAYYEENKDRLKLLGIDAGDGNCVQAVAWRRFAIDTYKPLSRPLFIYVQQVVARRAGGRGVRRVLSGQRRQVGGAGRLRAVAGRRAGQEQADARRGAGGRASRNSVVRVWHFMRRRRINR